MASVKTNIPGVSALDFRLKPTFALPRIDWTA
jgi:hypothetical protein